MANEDTQRLISMVEEQTGYRVMVGTSDIETADAQMISAKAVPPPRPHNQCVEAPPFASRLHCGIAMHHAPEYVVAPQGRTTILPA